MANFNFLIIRKNIKVSQGVFFLLYFIRSVFSHGLNYIDIYKILYIFYM